MDRVRDKVSGAGVVAAPEPLMLWRPVQRAHGDRLASRLVKSRVLESAETAARIREEARRLLAQCLPPDAPCGRRTGILLGYAEKSEFLSMAAVAALARDNGFRLVIVLTESRAEPFKRSRDRLESHLVDGVAPPLGWTAWSNPSLHRDRESLSALAQQWADARVPEERQPALFVSVMRHPLRIEQLTKLLETQNLAEVNALVLDDESGSSGGRAHPLAPDPGSVHAALRRLRDALPRHTCLQYTATAQASMLISMLDFFSPDFVDVIETGKQAHGGRARGAERADLVHVIPDDDRLELAAGSPEPPASLLRALRLFLLGVAVDMRRHVGQHRCMLVHSGSEEVDRASRRRVEQALQGWGELLALPPGNRSRQQLAAEFADARRELEAVGESVPPLEELLLSLAMEVPRISVRDAAAEAQEPARGKESFTHVLVGDPRLEDGRRLTGLKLAYLPRGRAATLFDAPDRRALALSFQRSQLGPCRVFLPQDLARVVREHAEQEEHVRAQVIAHRGRPTRDLRRTLILDSRCQPSQKAIRAQPFFRTQTRGWFKQTTPHVASALDVNIRRVESFLAARRMSRHVRYSHKVAAARLAEVIELLGKYAFGPDELLEAQIFIDQLMKVRERTPDAQVSVYLMQPDPRLRVTRSESDDSIELHDPRAGLDPDSYPGDAALRDASRVTLQVHWLRVSRIGDGQQILAAARVPALAIHIPHSL